MADMISWLDSHFGPALVRIASTLFPRRPVIQFEAGAGVTITAEDVPANKATKVTFGATAVVPSGTDGALQYKSGAANASANDFLYAGGRLTVSATGYLAYEASAVPATGMIRIPYNAGAKDILTRKDGSSVDRTFLGFTANVATLGNVATDLKIAAPLFELRISGALHISATPAAGLSLGDTTVSFFGGTPSFGGGAQVIYQQASTSPPTANPTGGSLLYVDAATGLPRARTPAGKVVTQGGDSPDTNGLRLTASVGNPLPTADVVGATTIDLSPYRSGSIAIYDGVSWVRRDTSGASVALGTLVASTNYDVFAYWTGSAVALELSAAWASNVARTDALTRVDGVLTKAANTTRRYVGTIRTTGTTTTEDSVLRRFVYNADNQIKRELLVSDATLTWTYASTVVRQARATASNRVEVVFGQPSAIDASVNMLSLASASGVRAIPGIGVDSTTVSVATPFGQASSSNFSTETNLSRADYDGVIGIGYHAINWLEALSSTSTTTLYGTGAGIVSTLRARVTM